MNTLHEHRLYQTPQSISPIWNPDRKFRQIPNEWPDKTQVTSFEYEEEKSADSEKRNSTGSDITIKPHAGRAPSPSDSYIARKFSKESVEGLKEDIQNKLNEHEVKTAKHDKRKSLDFSSLQAFSNKAKSLKPKGRGSFNLRRSSTNAARSSMGSNIDAPIIHHVHEDLTANAARTTTNCGTALHPQGHCSLPVDVTNDGPEDGVSILRSKHYDMDVTRDMTESRGSTSHPEGSDNNANFKVPKVKGTSLLPFDIVYNHSVEKI